MFGRHAAPISKVMLEAIERGTINLEGEESLEEFIEQLQEVQQNEGHGRASGVNLLKINNGRNTIEFRTPNGTLNPETWVENVRLFGRIVEMSQKLAEIEKKEELTDEEKRLKFLMKKLKEKMPEHDKMEYLLELLFSEDERTVYRERYDENTRILENLPEDENPLKTMRVFKFADGPIDFRKHSRDEYESVTNVLGVDSINSVTVETQKGVSAEIEGPSVGVTVDEDGEWGDNE